MAFAWRSARWWCRIFFGLAFTSGGEVLRVCSLIWRQGEQVGARFVTAKELRQGFASTAETDRRKAPA